MVMVSGSFWLGVEEVLNLLKEHSEKHKRPKQAVTKLQRWSGWASLAGGVLFVTAEVTRQAGDPYMLLSLVTYLSLSILGLIMFSAGVIVSVVDTVRSNRRPFVEHIDGIVEALRRERELIGALECFETVTLEFARKRLQLESSKVASRLAVIGGGEGLRTSLVGIAMLAAAMFSQYEPVIQGWTMKSVTYFGLALLVGLSIGGVLLRYGVSQAEYYSDIIGLALQRKTHLAKEPSRVPFTRRVLLDGGRQHRVVNAPRNCEPSMTRIEPHE